MLARWVRNPDRFAEVFVSAATSLWPRHYAIQLRPQRSERPRQACASLGGASLASEDALLDCVAPSIKSRR